MKIQLKENSIKALIKEIAKKVLKEIDISSQTYFIRPKEIEAALKMGFRVKIYINSADKFPIEITSPKRYGAILKRGFHINNEYKIKKRIPFNSAIKFQITNDSSDKTLVLKPIFDNIKYNKAWDRIK